MLDFYLFQEKAKQTIEEYLEQQLPATDTLPTDLHKAMRYSVLGGGKRLRACLIYAVAEATGTPWEQLSPIAGAIECLHAYSLIHDDLPAMDNDDIRRGKPTCHRAFNEAIAILAGDALQAFAFELLVGPQLHLCPEKKLKLAYSFSQAIGHMGMVGGQALDCGANGQKNWKIEQLKEMHQRKTGALIEVSLQMAALACPTIDAEERETLEDFGRLIGLAFQIQDDILDDTGQDALLEKPTYPQLLGLEGAKIEAAQLHHEASLKISLLPHNYHLLEELAGHIVSRIC